MTTPAVQRRGQTCLQGTLPAMCVCPWWCLAPGNKALNLSLTSAQLLKRISFVFSYFTGTAQARSCGFIWQVKPQVSNGLKHLLKPELALSHWALTMCLKLSPCLIALLNKTGITGTLSQHQRLGDSSLLQSQRLWSGNLTPKHGREFFSW